MTTKLKLDFNQGLLEVEGSETFVKKVFDDFKDRLSKSEPIAPSFQSGKQIPKAATKPKQKGTNNKVNTKAKKNKNAGVNVVNDLELAASGDIPSLKDFYAKFIIKTDIERNLLFIYYLEQVRKMSGGISVDVIFTCYRNLTIKIPADLKQSLRNASHTRSWIDTSDSTNIKTTTVGSNYVEHDLLKNNE
jgi:hypothetical protein